MNPPKGAARAELRSPLGGVRVDFDVRYNWRILEAGPGVRGGEAGS